MATWSRFGASASTVAASKHQATFFVEDGERTSAGLVALFDLRDGRNLALEVGRVVVDAATGEVVFDAGRHDLLNGPVPGKPTFLCPYLAGA